MADTTELLKWLLKAIGSNGSIWINILNHPGGSDWLRDVRALCDENVPPVIVRLVTPSDDEPTREALRLLEELPGIEVEVSYCPESVREWFQCPFLKCGDDPNYFGLDGIKFFIAERLKTPKLPERPDPVVIDAILEREERLGRYDYPDPQDFELLAAEVRCLRGNYSENNGGER